MQQIFAWLFVLVLAQAAAAEPAKAVVFEMPEFTFTTGLSEAVEEFEEFDLPFTNHTEKAVKVLSVETSCSCMKVWAVEKQVEPGATGRVHCVVRIPNSTGPIQKLIILNTDAPGGGMHVARIRVEVPSVLTLMPERLTWPLSSVSDEKLLGIQVADAAGLVNITKIEGPSDLFEWTLKTVRTGREFELRVRPKSTEKLSLGIFSIQTDSPVPRHQRHGFQAVVEPARGPGK